MKLKKWTLVILIATSFSALYSQGKSRLEILKDEERAIYDRCNRIASQFYDLDKGKAIKEITHEILESPDTDESLKNIIINTGRRFILFKYPSDGYQVKGHISFVPNSEKNNLLIFLRGGNRLLGLMHPATDYTCIRNYTVISTSYRGGASEGIDQFGGEEVNDVENLLLFLPILSKKLNLDFRPKNTFILGGSRGGMEMFLALGRSPFLQQQITKAVSLSGILDIEECMQYREDMRKMFIRDFGLIPQKNETNWIRRRNPINIVSNLRKTLPFLIIQGTNDLRISLNEGYRMLDKLRKNGNPVDYLEISGGNHCLSNQFNRMEIIADWLEQ